MKIISKIKDYYDSGLVYSFETDLIYLREPQTIKLRLERKPHSWKNKALSLNSLSHRIDVYVDGVLDSTSMRGYLIGFCGKIYPLIYFKGSEKSFYDLDTFNAFCQERKMTFKSSIFSSRFDPKQFFSNNNEWHALEDIFVNHNTPIFIYKGSVDRDSNSTNFDIFEIELNPKLSTYEFYKLKEPNQAFQEIAVYLGSVLKQPEKPIIEISDKDKINQHGFDPKYGFRKTPEKVK